MAALKVTKRHLLTPGTKEKAITVEPQALQQSMDEVADVVNRIAAKPFNTGVLVEGVVLSQDVVSIRHNLGRPAKGLIVVYKTFTNADFDWAIEETQELADAKLSVTFSNYLLDAEISVFIF